MGNRSLTHPAHVQSIWIKPIAPCLTQLELMQTALRDDDPDAAFLISFLLQSPFQQLAL